VIFALGIHTWGSGLYLIRTHYGAGQRFERAMEQAKNRVRAAWNDLIGLEWGRNVDGNFGQHFRPRGRARNRIRPFGRRTLGAGCGAP